MFTVDSLGAVKLPLDSWAAVMLPCKLWIQAISLLVTKEVKLQNLYVHKNILSANNGSPFIIDRFKEVWIHSGNSNNWIHNKSFSSKKCDLAGLTKPVLLLMTGSLILWHTFKARWMHFQCQTYPGLLLQVDISWLSVHPW